MQSFLPELKKLALLKLLFFAQFFNKNQIFYKHIMWIITKLQ